MEELFPLVNEQGDLIGKATRSYCHSGSYVLHPVVHLHVFNSAGQLFMQKRSMSKDIQPGMWDTSVGGHVDYKETEGGTDWVKSALEREAREELGISSFEPLFVCRYVFSSAYECELVHTFFTVYDGSTVVDPVEISEGRFWNREEILTNLGKGLFTPNFEGEIIQVLEAFDIKFR
ncbi:MAG TPA: NUDIX domain-containing protein [Bacteroidales bacterium]|nr:NUDIX domain-containing protein [Bacteroidales bacterium]